MVSFQTAVGNFFKKSFVFSGRATRAEYWWWAIFQFQINVDLMFFGGLLAYLFGGETMDCLWFVYIPQLVWALATFIPNLSLSVRRLHDAKYSGWWLLWILFPIAGPLVLFMATISPSDSDNKYGPNPIEE